MPHSPSKSLGHGVRMPGRLRLAVWRVAGSGAALSQLLACYLWAYSANPRTANRSGDGMPLFEILACALAVLGTCGPAWAAFRDEGHKATVFVGAFLGALIGQALQPGVSMSPRHRLELLLADPLYEMYPVFWILASRPPAPYWPCCSSPESPLVQNPPTGPRINNSLLPQGPAPCFACRVWPSSSFVV
jgi:hypothetical protein